MKGTLRSYEATVPGDPPYTIPVQAKDRKEARELIRLILGRAKRGNLPEGVRLKRVASRDGHGLD